MKVRHDEDVASYIGPEPCSGLSNITKNRVWLSSQRLVAIETKRELLNATSSCNKAGQYTVLIESGERPGSATVRMTRKDMHTASRRSSVDECAYHGRRIGNSPVGGS